MTIKCWLALHNRYSHTVCTFNLCLYPVFILQDTASRVIICSIGKRMLLGSQVTLYVINPHIITSWMAIVKHTHSHKIMLLATT
jgi:hypothetical protein